MALIRRKPPWHTKRTFRPSDSILRVWRKLAHALAQKRGARWACEICKRPLGNGATKTGGYGIVSVWRYGVTGIRRKICSACAYTIISFVKDLEWHGRNDNLPPEIIVGNEPKGNNETNSSSNT